MVVVVFASGRRLIFFDGKSAVHLVSGVKVYDLAKTLLFRSDEEVLSVTVDGHAITKSNPIAVLTKQPDDDQHA